VIELLLAGHYTGQSVLTQGDTQLRDTLCEYILNEHYNFRGHEVIQLLQRVNSLGADAFTQPFLKALSKSVKDVSQRPVIYEKEDNGSGPVKQSQTTSNRIKFVLRVTFSQRKTDLS
jgi:hypothetical protein